MWADASVAPPRCSRLPDSTVEGKMGYAHMPVNKTEESGWLWSWNLALPESTKNKDAADRVRQVGHEQGVREARRRELGWSNVPPGTRTSTYVIPRVQGSRRGLRADHPRRHERVDPKQPGVNPQPWVGIQYVTIPEFQDVGNQSAQLVADYIAGRTSSTTP